MAGLPQDADSALKDLQSKAALHDLSSILPQPFKNVSSISL